MDDNPIKPGDVLLVNCSANVEPFAAKWVVDSIGNVGLPYSGPWRVAGKRPSELARELSRYFSVRRSVIFEIEKIDSESVQTTATSLPGGSPPKKPVLASPKAGGTRVKPDRSSARAEKAGATG